MMYSTGLKQHDRAYRDTNRDYEDNVTATRSYPRYPGGWSEPGQPVKGPAVGNGPLADFRTKYRHNYEQYVQPKTGGLLYRVGLYRKVAVALLLVLLLGLIISNLLSFLSKNNALSSGVYMLETMSVSNSQSARAAASGDSVLGSPSISADKIDQVLKSYSSPAYGTGSAFYEQGVKYGIDPAFALAFFIHESSAGTQGIARVTKSIGNIRYSEGYENYQGFRKYASWEAGVEDWYRLIKELYVEGWKLTTVSAIVPVYAPEADNNDTQAYIRQVNDLVASWRQWV